MSNNITIFIIDQLKTQYTRFVYIISKYGPTLENFLYRKVLLYRVLSKVVKEILLSVTRKIPISRG